jgi:hypothetical protein
MNAIAFTFNDPSNAQAHGLHFGSKRYVFNKIEELQGIPVMLSKSVRRVLYSEIANCLSRPDNG